MAQLQCLLAYRGGVYRLEISTQVRAVRGYSSLFTITIKANSWSLNDLEASLTGVSGISPPRTGVRPKLTVGEELSRQQAGDFSGLRKLVHMAGVLEEVAVSLVESTALITPDQARAHTRALQFS